MSIDFRLCETQTTFFFSINIIQGLYLKHIIYSSESVSLHGHQDASFRAGSSAFLNNMMSV